MSSDTPNKLDAMLEAERQRIRYLVGLNRPALHGVVGVLTLGCQNRRCPASRICIDVDEGSTEPWGVVPSEAVCPFCRQPLAGLGYDPRIKTFGMAKH